MILVGVIDFARAQACKKYILESPVACDPFLCAHARKVEAFCRAAVGISSSGNRWNVCLALEATRELGAQTIAFARNVSSSNSIPTASTVSKPKNYNVIDHLVFATHVSSKNGQVTISRKGTCVDLTSKETAL